MNYKERYDALMDEAKKVARPIVHTEFVCPCCGGVASTVIENGNISAECHCCNTRGYRNWERFAGWMEKRFRRTI